MSKAGKDWPAVSHNAALCDTPAFQPVRSPSVYHRVLGRWFLFPCFSFRVQSSKQQRRNGRGERVLTLSRARASNFGFSVARGEDFQREMAACTCASMCPEASKASGWGSAFFVKFLSYLRPLSSPLTGISCKPEDLR